ncbi:DUF4136 domain-containing protein [Algoriphagus sp. H41]|uniref:DUF4136 domain-containing protein n=1 Tax=Algoriphagus oliviformis TaxID=2811231 RepID=A0ABS3C275_9BACT|nr:DUF4136 domain-containing protein [Algoriphagus oliviformis]MBN7810701.1 DUF4136 domain-containing protein [Algoriphagus oliviformis]
MKKTLFVLSLALLIFSCKTSETVTVDTVAKKEQLKYYQTFKVVENDKADRRSEMLTGSFRKALLEYGYEEVVENPDFLIQSVLVTREYVQELGAYSSQPPAYIDQFYGIASGGTSDFVVNKGMIGKVIFLIQDSQTNEIAWMGVGTGVTQGSKQISMENLDLALYELLATLN